MKSLVNKEILNLYLETFHIWNFFKDRSILITGSKGVLGTGLIQLLLYANRKYNLNLIIYASTRKPNIIPSFIESNDPIIYIPYLQEKDYLLNKEIYYVIHAASPTDRNIFKERPFDVFETIVHDTERIVNLSIEKNVKSMLYISSDAEYGSWYSDEPIIEKQYGPLDSLNYRSCYPLGKKASEYICYSSCIQNGLNVKIIRPSIILGLYQDYNDSKVMSYFLRCLVENKNIVLNTRGESVKPLIFTLDACLGCLFVLLYGAKGEAYNLTNKDICKSISEYAEYLVERYGKGTKVEYDIIDIQKAGFAQTSKLALNTDKITSLGWFPIADLDMIFDFEIRRFNNETN